MYITFGSRHLKFDKWANESEMKHYLSKFKDSFLTLGKNLYSGSLHYTITVDSPAGKFGIGISSDYVGLHPDLLLDYARQNLILGFGRSVYFIHIPSKKLVAELTLDYNFHQFLSLFHLGMSDFFLAQHEVGVKAISFDEVQKWDYTGNDIVTNITLEEKYVLLQYMESTDKHIILELQSGKLTTGILDSN